MHVKYMLHLRMLKIDTRKNPKAILSQRIAATKLRDDGLTFIEIAKKLGCSRACASRWCKLNDEQLKPKKRGIKEKIDLESKVKIKTEFIASGLSVRKFIKKIRPDLDEVLSQRTAEKYLAGLSPQAHLKRLSREERLAREEGIESEKIKLDEFCQICDKSWPLFCRKVKENSKMNGVELKQFFGLWRKSEDWEKWETGKNTPLNSTKIFLAFFAYTRNFSNGEMLPEGLIKSEVYKKIYNINWDKLTNLNKDLDSDELIENLVSHGLQVFGEPRKHRNQSTIFSSKEFDSIGKLLIPYFSLLADEDISDKTWITRGYFRMPSHLLELILWESHRQYYRNG